jgi:hypothetical protein
MRRRNDATVVSHEGKNRYEVAVFTLHAESQIFS